MEQLNKLTKDGWKLQYEGISLAKYQYDCEPCSKTGAWYEVFNHMDTSKHKKAVSSAEGLPVLPPSGVSAEERQAWETLVSKSVAMLEEKIAAAPKPEPKLAPKAPAPASV